MELRQPLAVRFFHLRRILHQRQRNREQSAVCPGGTPGTWMVGFSCSSAFAIVSHAPPYSFSHSGFAATFLRKSSSSACFFAIRFLSASASSPADIDLKAVLQTKNCSAHLSRLLRSLRRIRLGRGNAPLQVLRHRRLNSHRVPPAVAPSYPDVMSIPDVPR